MRRRYASGAFIPRIRLAARRMAITAQTGLWMECLSALVPGTTFTTFTPHTIARFISTVDLVSGRVLSGSTAIGLIALTGLIVIAGSVVSTGRVSTMIEDLIAIDLIVAVGLIATADLIEAVNLMRREGSAETIAALEALTAAIMALEE